MQKPINPAKRSSQAYALLMVLVFTGMSLISLTSVLQWSLQNSNITRRHAEFQSSTALAEGVVDRAASEMAKDFKDAGEARVYSSLSDYRRVSSDQGGVAEAANYEVSSPQSGSGQIYVERITPVTFRALESKYTGLFANVAVYRLIAEARDLRAGSMLKASVRQDLQAASIPLSSFGMFYGFDLEICPSADMNLTGRIHSNANIYCYPNGEDVYFYGHITASHQILRRAHPDDPTARSLGRVSYRAEHDDGVNSMHLPIGPNPSGALLRSMIEIPPPGESRGSAMGLLRFYNKADLIILVNNTNVIASSGVYNNFATSIPWSETQRFVDTNTFFYNARESREIAATELDLSRFFGRFTQLRAYLGRDPVVVYVADLRNPGPSKQIGVKLKNGQTLPLAGLTFATPNPLYVEGHFNAFSSHLGTTNTTRASPALLASDALTILSGGWRDDRSYDDLSRRDARDTTINAAIITGIVPTRPGSYSGGFENTFRLLEDWSGETLTFNGSLTVLFESVAATAPWGTAEVYSPPRRSFGWDSAFSIPARVPVGMPEIRTILRARWTVNQPGEMN